MPRPFEKLLPGHDVVHTSRLGWGNLENGNLLSEAEQNGFELMVTVDQNMPYQQSIAKRNICVFVLICHSNSIRALMPFGTLVEAALARVSAGTVVELTLP